MQERTGTVPPYVPYRTFRTFLEFLTEGIPDRIDRSVWGSRFSGTSGSQLMTALKVLGLIDATGRPQRELERLVSAEGRERREALRDMLRRSYGPVFELDLTRATRAQFHEAFRRFGAREGVLAKCEAFFIQAARDAGIELSQYITAGRHGDRRPSAPRASRASGQTERTPPTGESAAPGQAHPNLALAQRILEKYPDFDPSWSPEVQASWLNGMTRLYEGLSGPAPDVPESPAQGT